jgi:outer membrane protein
MLMPLLFALALMPRYASANDLMRLYQLAQQRDSVLQAAKYQRDAAIEARPQALAQWLPQLAGSASADRERLSEPASQFGLTPTQSGTPPPLGAIGLPGCELATSATVRCNVSYTTYGLTLTQTLWSFQSYSQLREADSQAASAEATYLSAQQALVVRMAQAYFAALQAQDLLAAYSDERAAYAMLLKQTQGRAQTGVGSASDVKQAQAYYDLSAQNLISARNGLDDANLALAQIIGEPAGHLAPLRDAIPLAAPDPASADAWVISAESDNPDVRAALLSSDAARHDIGVQRGKGLPTLSLTGTGAYTSAPAGVLGGNHALDTVGVYFNWPLFQGGAVASAVRQSRALYRESEANLQTLRRQIEQQTRTAYLNIVSGIESINATRRAIDSTRAAVEAAQRDIEFNVGNEFALLGYQGDYYSALFAYDQARYAYLNNVLLLKQQAGRLGERDLAAIDALLAGASTTDAPATGGTTAGDSAAGAGG